MGYRSCSLWAAKTKQKQTKMLKTRVGILGEFSQNEYAELPNTFLLKSANCGKYTNSSPT